MINLLRGYNDLATINPELNKQWHPTKNGYLKPTDVTASSGQKVWWLYPYDDPITKKHFDFEWQAKIYHRNRGNGCPYLVSSKTEVLLYELMKKYKISFKPEYKFPDCKDKNKLPFDLYLPSYNIAIECDGLQHFKLIKHFGEKEKFKLTKKHDNIKNKYCKDNNISLLRIPYIYDPNVDKNQIEEIVLEFIKTKIVPQEIKDFYAKHKFSNYEKNGRNKLTK